MPRNQNSHADTLARLALARDVDFLGVIPMEFLAALSTEGQGEVSMITVASNSWMKPIIDYVQEGKLPNNKVEMR